MSSTEPNGVGTGKSTNATALRRPAITDVDRVKQACRILAGTADALIRELRQDCEQTTGLKILAADLWDVGGGNEFALVMPLRRVK